MFPGWMQILVIVLLVVVLFGGRNKISGLMGDTAKGIKAFKDGLKDDTKSEKTEAESLPKSESEKEELKS
jgi:sec-independent protein translocase protein TatA